MVEVLEVCVNSNEASARWDIVKYLRLACCEVEVRNLPVCDYVVEIYHRRIVAPYIS